MSALSVRGLVLDYPGPLRALDEVDLELGQGELLAVIGPNGAGKSSLLRCAAGLVAPTAGDVAVLGTDLAQLRARERARKIAVVPQYLPELFDVSVSSFVSGGRYAHASRWRGPGPRDRDAVRGALEACDAGELGERLLAELSGGQRQRVRLARAVAQEAEILLVDEPTGSLDPDHQLWVFELLAALVAEGRAVVVTTHELNLASQFASRLVLLEGGRVAAGGDPAQVLRREVLEPVYGPRLHYGRLAGPGGGEIPFVLPWRGPPGSGTGKRVPPRA